MRKLRMLLLLAIAVGGAGASHAFSYDSIAKYCLSDGKTYACPEAWTSISWWEVPAFNAVHVRAVFDGPDYSEERSKDSPIVSFIPSSWTAKVTYWKCAYSGAHSVSGSHWFTVGSETTEPEQIYDVFIRHFCDCGPGPD